MVASVRVRPGLRAGVVAALILASAGWAWGAAPTSITSARYASAVIGTPFSYTITSDGTAPLTYRAIPVPQGLGFSGNVISGTPTVPGTFVITLTATNGAGECSAVLYLTVTDFAGVIVTGPPTAPASAADEGPAPIARFSQNTGGGTEPVAVTFDPSASYLPLPPPSQTYLYYATWDFGDTTIVTLGPSARPADVLHTVTKVFSGNVLYNIVLRLSVTIRSADDSDSFGPSNITSSKVRLSSVNYPPTAVLENTGSPPDGTLPYVLTVNPSYSADQDGYLVWGAINWGDGSVQMLDALPPHLPSRSLQHTYFTGGYYRVTLSLVDNGRIPLGSNLLSIPGAGDPVTALAAVKAYQNANFPQVSVASDPKLHQAFLDVQIPANLEVLDGRLKVDFNKPNNDSLILKLRANVPLDAQNVPIVVTLQDLALGASGGFVLDSRGKFNISGFLSFTYNSRKRVIQLKLTRTSLATLLKVPGGMVSNGNVDVPLRIVVNNMTTLGTKARFSYSARGNGKGTGAAGRAQR